MRTSRWLSRGNVSSWNWLRLDTPEQHQFRMQHPPHVTPACYRSLLPSATRQGRHLRRKLPTHTAASSDPATTPVRHPPSTPSKPNNTTNHELLHLSRILDARTDRCVYKSIRQLPLDYLHCDNRLPTEGSVRAGNSYRETDKREQQRIRSGGIRVKKHARAQGSDTGNCGDAAPIRRTDKETQSARSS